MAKSRTLSDEVKRGRLSLEELGVDIGVLVQVAVFRMPGFFNLCEGEETGPVIGPDGEPIDV